MDVFFVVADLADGGRDFQVSIEMDDDGAYRLHIEDSDGPSEERFQTYADAVEGIVQLWPGETHTITLARA